LEGAERMGPFWIKEQVSGSAGELFIKG